MQKIWDFLMSFSLKQKKELTFWALLTVVFLAITAYGHFLNIGGTQAGEYIVMYAINSVIFFSLFKYYHELGVTMLIFMFFFELSVLGYYFFSAVSLSA